MLNEVIESLNWNIRIRIDDDTDRIVTQIIDPGNNEIIKQIPPQELLEIMSRLRNIVGLLLDIEILSHPGSGRQPSPRFHLNLRGFAVSSTKVMP